MLMFVLLIWRLTVIFTYVSNLRGGADFVLEGLEAIRRLMS